MAPLGVVAIAGAVASMLAYARRLTTPRRVQVQFAIAMVSWAVLWFATASGFAREGMVYLPDHMIGHILVMFIVPMGLVGSGFARSLWWLLGVTTRRRLLRWWYVTRKWHAPRWLAHPLAATVVLNVVMVSAHQSVIFDFLMSNQWSMDWLMEPAFLFSGLYFFHYVVPAPPRRNHVALRWQFIMIVTTMAEMLILAMAMSIFTSTSWYSVMTPHPGMVAMAGMAKTAADAFSQQRLAAAILWICGDVWAVPLLVVVVRRVIARDGSLFAALERQSSALSGVTRSSF